MKNRRAIYWMLNVETALMDAILKFAIVDIPKLGLACSVILLQRTSRTQLRRLSIEFDLNPGTQDLL